MLDQYAVIGNPISHSLSPKIHKLFAEQTEQALEYKALFAELDQFKSVVNHFIAQEGKGLNITVPFKLEAYQFAEQKTERAKKAKAVNTLSFKEGMVYGDNTDGVGLLTDLKRLSFDITNKNILIIGAGGATQGILYPLLQEKPQQIILANRTVSKAENLAEEFKTTGNILACSLDNIPQQCFDGVIHTTALGHHTGDILFPQYIINQNTWVYDISYGKAALPFLDWAKQIGAIQYSDGLGMLIGQAAESFYIWRGIRPQIEPILTQLQSSSSL